MTKAALSLKAILPIKGAAWTRGTVPYNMADPRLSLYQKLLAKRGLTVLRFAGGTLYLRYGAQKDEMFKAGQLVDASDLSRYAMEAQSELGGPALFPGCSKIEIDLSRL